jgi:threonylcarbamoyladenosine tRNA methylthiotransferase MtaB
MGRTDSAPVFLDKVAEIRRRFGTVGLSTDVIVGFPGESPDAFDRTLQVCRQAGFTRIHAFPFSPRDGTRAAVLPGRPSTEEVRSRMSALAAEGRRLADAFRRSRVGRTDRVLAERDVSGRPGFLEGWDVCYQRVIFPGQPGDLGELIPMRITGVEGEVCVAERL